MAELIIIDGSNYVYRAFYSHKNFKNSKGEPTGAIFGFIKSIQRIKKNNPNAEMIIVFDTKGNSFRNSISDDYKETRNKVPLDLKVQFPIIRNACDICGYTHIEDTLHDPNNKYEADDIIASLTKRNIPKYDIITIYTGDKDLYQLIGTYNNCNIRVHDANLRRIVTQDDIIKKFGVDSSKLGEWLMLVGDSSDNIHGCEGIGKILASKLLNQYGSINNIYKHFKELPKPIQQKMLSATSVLPKMQRLVSLRFDYPCSDLVEPVYNKVKFEHFCKRYEMFSLLKQKPVCEL